MLDSTLLFVSSNRRSGLQRVWQFYHVHGRTADFVFRSMSCGGPSPVSTQFEQNKFTQAVASLSPGAIRFLLWWLFLHRRLRSRQRGSMFRRTRAASLPQADHLRRVSQVFIPLTQNKPFGSSLASLSASTSGVPDSGFPLLLS